MKLTVITPTLLRPHLIKTIEAVDALLEEGDEHLVIVDTANATGNARPEGIGRFTKVMSHHDETSKFGNAQRDAALSIAKGDCAIFIDDDDMPGAGGFAALHAEPADPNTFHFFWMMSVADMYPPGWEVKQALIGGGQVVPPIRPDLPKWMANNIYEADFTFIKGVLALPGMQIKRHNHFICMCTTGPSRGL